jgi:CheY-like chemotaxis protein
MKEVILIVEDNPNIRYNICELLEQEGYKTMQAANGEEALILIKSN